MKRLVTIFMLIAVVATASFAGQFRIAGLWSTGTDALPTDSVTEWSQELISSGQSLTGWQWEVIFHTLGLGMHYGVDFYQDDADETWLLDWKGDFFVSYHFLESGSVADPFVEFGWGNAGTTTISSPREAQYPDWEEELEDGDALALSLFSYAAAGFAVDLNGLLFGVKFSYFPPQLVTPIPATRIDMFDLANFEVGLFGGVALGGHHNSHHRH